MGKYRVVEYSQNVFGVVASKIMPDGLQPAFREGDPVVIKSDISTWAEADRVLQTRKKQLTAFGGRERVSVEIEEMI